MVRGRGGGAIYTRRKGRTRRFAGQKRRVRARSEVERHVLSARPPGNDVSNEHEGNRRRDAPAPNSVRHESIDPVDQQMEKERKRERGRERERPADLHVGSCDARVRTHACGTISLS